MDGYNILYSDPVGNSLNISVTASTTINGSDFNITSQGTTNSGSRGGAITLKTGSSSTDKSGILTFKLGNYNSAATISAAEATLGARALGFCLSQASMDSVIMPAGTGDNVIYIGNATDDPSTGDPVGGAILYASGGVLKVRQSDGYTVTIGSGFTDATSTFSLADPGSGNPVTFQIDTVATNSAGAFNFYGQDTTFSGGTGGNINLRSGDSSTGIAGAITLKVGGDSELLLSAAETSTGVYNLGLVVNSATFTSAKLPANTGDGVIYIGNATTNPTSGSPVDGFVLYGSLGNAYIKQSDGTEYKIGPAPTAKVTTSTDVVYFPLDDGYGTTTITNEGSGTAFTLTLNNTATFEYTTPIGDCCLIENDGYFQGTGTALTYQGSVTDFTAECWVEFVGPVITSASVAPFFGKEEGGAGDVTFALGVNLTSAYQLINSIKTSVTGFLAINVIKLEPWVRYHVCMTYDGSNVKSYVNGNLIVTTACTGTLVWDNTYSWTVGNVGSGSVYHMLRGCRFSDTAKSAATIKQIYLAGRPSW